MFRIWEDVRRPLWEHYLEDAPDYIIDETKLSKEELKNILEILYKHRIIN